MFIDCAKLEKILKADYKTWGVKFGLTDKGMYILNLYFTNQNHAARQYDVGRKDTGRCTSHQ